MKKKKDGEEPMIVRARKAKVSLVCYETPDQPASVAAIIELLKGIHPQQPIMQWDYVRGCKPASNEQQVNGWIINNPLDPAQKGQHSSWKTLSAIDRYAANPLTLFALLSSSYPSYLTVGGGSLGCVVIVLGGHNLMEQKDVLQALSNLRDDARDNNCMIILMGPQFTVPPELQNDVLTIVEDLPDEKELRRIVTNVVEGAKFAKGDKDIDPGVAVPKEDREKASYDLLGLSRFKARQSTELALTPSGIELCGLNEMRWKAIESTVGLSHWEGDKETDGLCSVGGLDYAKKFLVATIMGKLKVQVIVLLDEGDKDLSAGSVFGDTSATKQDQHKSILTHMQDNKQKGAIFAGPPGTGKTKLPQAVAAECGIPLIKVDMGALLGPYVGQSQAQIRRALQIIQTVSRGAAFWILTCNRPAGLMPETRRRFSYGLLYFDLPDRKQLDQIWSIHINAYGLKVKKGEMPEDNGWTGSEVENCCMKAWATETTIRDAAQSIIPISRVDGERITSMRVEAQNNYVCANTGKAYKIPAKRNVFSEALASLT